MAFTSEIDVHRGAWRGRCLWALLTMASFPPLGLEADLRVRLHGQHLARELVLAAVRGYLELPQPDKALALSFHGSSGTGKNFVARLLAENLFRDGLRSNCVQVFIATLHFPHPKYVDQYKVRPAAWAGPHTGLCSPGPRPLGRKAAQASRGCGEEEGPVTRRGIRDTQMRPWTCGGKHRSQTAGLCPCRLHRGGQTQAGPEDPCVHFSFFFNLYIMILIFFHYSWFTVFCQFSAVQQVTQSHIHV